MKKGYEETVLPRKLRSPEDLTACFRAITAIGAGLDLDAVIERTMTAAEELMDAEAASILLLDEATGELYFRRATGIRGDEVEQIRIPPGRGIAGWVVENRESVLIQDAAKDPRHFGEVDARSKFKTRNMIAVPLVVQGKVIGCAQVLNRREGAFTESDLALFEAFATLVAISIENARLYRRQMEAAETERALEIAREIQARLQGPPHFHLDFVEVAGESVPAVSIGGDFFDVHYDGTHCYLAVGDVSGKGIPASLLMADCLGRLRADVERRMEPGDILFHLNRSWFRRAQGGRFLTIVLARIAPDGELLYAHAGHVAPAVFRPGHAEFLPDVGSVPIGVVEDVTYRTGRSRLMPGDRVLLATDGLFEAGEGTSAGELGMGGVKRYMAEAEESERPGGTVARLIDLMNRREQENVHDDRTVLAASYRQPPSVFRFQKEDFSADDLAGLRAEVRKFLGTTGVQRRIGAREADRIVLALDEASSNVVRHAYGGAFGPYRIEIRVAGSEMNVTIDDEGSAKVPKPVTPGERGGRFGGLGLHILNEIMDEVRFDPKDPRGLRVEMTKHLVLQGAT